jgi:hypothetical protein
MHTLTDFMTHVKGIEYLLSVVAITGFILYVEVLKPRPFKTLAKATSEDLDYLRKTGRQSAMTSLKRLAAAPFIGLAYVLALPFIFTFALCGELLGIAADGLDRALGTAGRSLSFGWRPMEAYLGGRRKARKEKAVEREKKQEEKA